MRASAAWRTVPGGSVRTSRRLRPAPAARDRLGVAELISGLGQEQLRHPRCRRAQRCARAAVVHHDVDLAEDLVLWHEAFPRRSRWKAAQAP